MPRHKSLDRIDRCLKAIDRPDYESSSARPVYLKVADVSRVDEPSDSICADMRSECSPAFLANFSEPEVVTNFPKFSTPGHKARGRYWPVLPVCRS